jgi:hypothetical protein
VAVAPAPVLAPKPPPPKAPPADAFLRVVTVYQGKEAWAQIRIDGVAAGKSPIAVWKRVEAGEHDVAARRDGYEPASQHVRLGAGERRKVKLELTKVEP